MKLTDSYLKTGANNNNNSNENENEIKNNKTTINNDNNNNIDDDMKNDDDDERGGGGGEEEHQQQQQQQSNYDYIDKSRKELINTIKSSATNVTTTTTTTTTDVVSSENNTNNTNNNNSVLQQPQQQTVTQFEHPIARIQTTDHDYYQTKNRIYVGRKSKFNRDCEISFEQSNFISRKHFYIEFNELKKQFFVFCMSKNGIFVDCRYVAPGQPHQLDNHCTLRFPNTTIKIYFDSLINKYSKEEQKPQPQQQQHSDIDDNEINNENEINSNNNNNEEIHNKNEQQQQQQQQQEASSPLSSLSPASSTPIQQVKTETCINTIKAFIENKCPIQYVQKPELQQPQQQQDETVINNNNNTINRLIKLENYDIQDNIGTSSNNNNNDDSDNEDINDANHKPPFSYAQLIEQAILTSNEKQLTLNQIYTYISKTYPYYKLNDKGWQNSIRHNLSLNRYFVKIARQQNELGKGSFWRIDPKYESKVIEQAFQRKRSRSLTNNNRKSNGDGLSPPDSPVSINTSVTAITTAPTSPANQNVSSPMSVSENNNVLSNTPSTNGSNKLITNAAIEKLKCESAPVSPLTARSCTPIDSQQSQSELTSNKAPTIAYLCQITTDDHDKNNNNNNNNNNGLYQQNNQQNSSTSSHAQNFHFHHPHHEGLTNPLAAFLQSNLLVPNFNKFTDYNNNNPLNNDSNHHNESSSQTPLHQVTLTPAAAAAAYVLNYNMFPALRNFFPQTNIMSPSSSSSSQQTPTPTNLTLIPIANDLLNLHRQSQQLQLQQQQQQNFSATNNNNNNNSNNTNNSTKLRYLLNKDNTITNTTQIQAQKRSLNEKNNESQPSNNKKLKLNDNTGENNIDNAN